MKIRKTLGVLLGAGALVFALAGTTSAALKYATPYDWYASTAGDGSNDAGFWEDRLGLDEGSCTKIEGEALDAVMNSDGSASLGVAYDWVIVKQANPNAKDVTYDNTIFKDVAADETVFADTNGDGDYDTDDSNGISHIFVCGPSETSSSTTFTDTVSESTTSSLPNTATIGGNSSDPSDFSWLLVAAVGMLLGSALVLTPARAKTRR